MNFMNLSAIIPVVKSVLTDTKVILVLVFILLYWSFISFVLYYKKRTRIPRGKKQKAAAGSPATTAPSEAPAEGAPAAEAEESSSES